MTPLSPANGDQGTGIRRGAGPGPRDPGGAQPNGGGAPRPHGDAVWPGSGVSRASTRVGTPAAPPGTALPPTRTCRTGARPPRGPRSGARRTDLRVPGRRVCPGPCPSAPAHCACQLSPARLEPDPAGWTVTQTRPRSACGGAGRWAGPGGGRGPTATLGRGTPDPTGSALEAPVLCSLGWGDAAGGDWHRLTPTLTGSLFNKVVQKTDRRLRAPSQSTARP